jgi:hypothetical protein
MSCTWASSAPVAASWAGEVEVFLVANQVSGPVVEAAVVSLNMSGRRSADGGVRAYVLAAALDARAYANGGGARADVGASRARAYATEGRAVRWSQCE